MIYYYELDYNIMNAMNFIVRSGGRLVAGDKRASNKGRERERESGVLNLILVAGLVQHFELGCSECCVLEYFSDICEWVLWHTLHVCF